MDIDVENKIAAIKAILNEMPAKERRNAIQTLTNVDAICDCGQSDDSKKIEILPQTVAKYQVMNRALEMISVETDFDSSVDNLLAMIGQELGADRCYVFRFTDNDQFCSNTHEWTIRPEIAEKDNLQNIPTCDCNWYKFLVGGKPIVINNTNEPSREYNDVIGLLRRQNIKSVFLIDLREDGKLVGFLGVDFVDKYNVFSDSNLQMLKNAAKLYGIVCGRSHNMNLIKEKNAEIANREVLLNTVINSLSANVFAKDADNDFRYVIANRHFAKFVGKPVAEIIGKTDRDLFSHAEDWTWFEERDAEIMSSGKSRSFTESVFNCEGKKFELQTIKTPCEGPLEKNLLLGISVDISRNAIIAKSREIIRQCLETLILDPNLDEGINRSISQVREYIGADHIYIFHFDFAKKVGRFYRNFYAADCQPMSEEKIDIPFSTSFPWEKYFRDECFFNLPDLQDENVLKKFGSYYGKIIRDRNGKSLYCHRILINGKLWGYVGIVFSKSKRILTEDELDFVQSTARFVEIMIKHEQMQSELITALKEAKASEKAKSYFLASMSHEIRTPLNAVIGFSEILKDGTLPPETQKSYLKDISIAGNALLALINDVLDLSKLEAGQMTFTPLETDFSALVNEVSVIFQQRLRDKNLENHINIDSMPTLLIDKLRMRQILFNLFGNAVKFTERGYIDFSATFTPVGNNSGTLRFSLTDTGCGIPEDEQKRLFQPFKQSNSIRGTQAERNGTGLGLAIVRKMLERLHGEIELKSEVGKGSTFTVTMRNVGFIIRRRLKTLNEAAPNKNCDNFSGHVLIVDDVMMNLKVTQAMLKKIGISSDIASTPAAALKCLEEKDITFILCDLWMPIMNGDELARKIRKMYPHRNMKIIALTADTEIDGAFEMNVFDGILRKPISIEALKATLQNSPCMD